MGRFETIGQRLERSPTGFDYLRLVLATAVLVWHSACVTMDPLSLWRNPAIRGSEALILPMFFAISGFLVAGSLARNSVAGFLTLRFLRLTPALAIVLLWTAFVIGPLLTALPMAEYLPRAALYQLHLVGLPVGLPIFLDRPLVGNVNASLWTIPLEACCYMGLALPGLFAVTRRTVFMLSCSLAVAVVALRAAPPNDVTSGLLIGSFALGVGVFTVRRWMPASFLAALTCLALAFWLNATDRMTLAAPFAVYGAINLGLARLSKLKADLSYGVYLAAFPIQQLVWALPPGKVWLGNLAIASVLTFAYAALSWRFVEAPVLAKKAAALDAVQRWMENVSRPRLKASEPRPARSGRRG